MRLVFITSIFLLIFNNSFSQNRAYNILKKSTEIMKTAKNMTYSNFAVERIDGKTEKGKLAHTKVNVKPYKVYLKQEREGGAEILYNTEITTTTALVNPGSFPYINLNLDPNGSIMHKGEHHSILQADINYTYNIVNHSLKTEADKKKVSYINTVIIKGVKYHKIKLTNSNYKIVTYKVKPNEDLIKIAKKLYLNSYSIIELNNNINGLNDVKSGQIIKVPSHYAKETIMYINTDTYLLYKILVYDNKGLYEAYEFRNLKINVNFKPDEFSKYFSEYNF